ncbi:MAG: COX15/CtaA family protein [Thermoanaerobaculia bacterium]|jgi:cytochrome c oxidase assembly protein subunit 15
MQHEDTLSTPAWLRRFTKVTAFSTLLLIFAGAMVTSTSSGLAVPDWPLAYGQVFPPMVGGILFEHGHRLIAATVGFLVLVQAFMLQVAEPKATVRNLGWLALAAVVVQGVLGGMTVIFQLPVAVSVGHASLAQIFLCLCVSIAFLTSRFSESLRVAPELGELRPLSKFLVGAVFAQIVIGALMRHKGAGLAIPDFPLSLGRVVPEFTNAAIAINFMHRAWGVAVAIAILALGPMVRRRAVGPLRTIYATLMGAVVIQILFGAFTVWTAKSPIVTSVHVMFGAFVLANALVFALTAARMEREAGAPAPIGREVTA